jgi:hypothetical protein
MAADDDLARHDGALGFFAALEAAAGDEEGVEPLFGRFQEGAMMTGGGQGFNRGIRGHGARLSQKNEIRPVFSRLMIDDPAAAGWLIKKMRRFRDRAQRRPVTPSAARNMVDGSGTDWTMKSSPTSENGAPL